MASTIGKTHCVTCGKDKVAYKCEGCSQNFCVNHLAGHHQELGLQLDEVEHNRNCFRQILMERMTNPQIDSFMQQIDNWEQDSINIILQTADDARQLLAKRATENIEKIENKLIELTEQLQITRQENDFNELHLNYFKQTLKELEEQLKQPSNISVRQESSSFVGRIHIVFSSAQPSIPNISMNTKWMQNGITVAGGNANGGAFNQLSYPWGIYVDGDDETIYVADQCNHRIMKWKKGSISGEVVAGGNGQGNGNDQLNRPMTVIVDKRNDSLIICDRGNQRIVRWPRQNGTHGETIISNVTCCGLMIHDDGSLYVSDISKNEVRRYDIGDATGTIVAGGNGKGNRFDQLNTPHFIFVDHDHSVYVSDSDNHRIMKWVRGAKEGVVVAGGQGQGYNLTQLSSPFGIVVDQFDTIYVANQDNNQVMRWLKGATQGDIVLGGNDRGRQMNQFDRPRGLSLDRQNNLYVVDYYNHRVQKFNIELNSMR